MFKKLIGWFFFTIVAGLLPIGLKIIMFVITERAFMYYDICSEVYFFDIIISANGLNSLYEIDNKSKIKIALFATLVFFIIVLSWVYGVLSLAEEFHAKLYLEPIYLLSIVFTVCCFIINLSIQLIKGVENNGE
ncbi:MAG: hypothetical protein NC417_07330 [Candidatus Gastranaerophilales bacterium]|nr:hypothetical protein [Candidatus Gastranaerophilales bacterium]